MVSQIFLALLLVAPNSAQALSATAKSHQATERKGHKRAAVRVKPATQWVASQSCPSSVPSKPAGRQAGDMGAAPPEGGWFMAQRLYPFGAVPDDAVSKAMAQRRALETTFTSKDDLGLADAATTWSPLGPASVNSPEGTASGRVTAIAVDSRNPDTIYIGASGGGVWRSTDAGATWQGLGDNLLSLVSGSLALDERSGVLYYGTGDHGAGTYGAGLLRSPDSGITWINSSGWDSNRNKPQFTVGTTPRIVLHPGDPKTVYVARNSGLWRSTNGGDTWYQMSGGVASDFALEPGNPSYLWLALGRNAGGTENGVYWSFDSGNTWMRPNGLPFGSDVGRISFAIAPSNSSVMYASFVRALDQQLYGVYKSVNGGNLWTRLPAPASVFDSAGRGQGYFDNFIAVDPRDPNSVYLGGVELYKTTDGGQTWNLLSLSGNTRIIHEDQFAIAFKPGNADTVYLGNDGGIYKSTDAGATWTSLNNGLPITQFNSVAVNPQNALDVLGGTQDQGLIRFSGNSVWNQLFRGDAGVAAFDQINPANITSAKQFTRLMRSTNNGAGFANVGTGIDPNDRVAFYAPLAVSPANSSVLYFGTYRVWSSLNGGASWSANSGDLTNGGYLTALAVSSDGTRVFAGSSGGQVSNISSFSGSWRSGSGLPNRFVTAIASHPSDSNIAYLTVSGWGTGHVFRTIDGGTTWTDISGNLPDAPASAVAVDPRGPVYVATDIGVFRTEDGASWTSFNVGLPNVFLTGLALDARSGTLTAATYGRGAYQINLKPPQTGPNVLAGGVVNSATFQPVIAPGTIVTLFGSRLAPAQAVSQVSPLPTTLAGTSVSVNGQPAPLFFVSPGQINFQFPFEAAGAQAAVVVTTAEGKAAIAVQVLPTAPGIFQGTVVHGLTGVPVSESNPAVPGEVLILFATGLGVTNPAVPSGTPSPSSPPATTAASVAAVLGTLNATVQFAGLAPGFTGLYQVNLTVPDGASGAMPLTIWAGGRASNSVSVAVRQ